MKHDIDNTIFQQAVSFVSHTHKHLFLTGKAGTGKTTFLKYIRGNCFKKMAVVAPTGVAAVNAGGVTIHSFFQLPFGMFLPTERSGWGETEANVYNKNRLLSNLRLNKAKRDLIQELDLLIIDEVSMVRADMMDAIDTVLRHVRRQHHMPFGGVQMLYIGDLFQLPPVVKDVDRALLSEHYQSPFFFDAHCIQETQPVYLELRKIYRQTDRSFISILNNIRNNDCSYEDMEILHQFYKPGFEPAKNEGYITLTSHNNRADTINRSELKQLSGKSHHFQAIVTGDFQETAYPVERELQLKEGAQIMFVKNDKGEMRRYYNGKIGTIDKIDEHNKKIIVSFPGENDRIELGLEKWQNIRYYYSQEKDKVDEEELGTFSQYPIRLAWAITIHKSQGLTFEKAVIDAEASFAPGQVYVALSRLTSLDGLVLRSPIHAHNIAVDPRVVAFTEKELPEDFLQKVLEQEQLVFVQQSLVNAFDWIKISERMKEHHEEYEHRAIPDKAKSISWSDAMLLRVKKQQEVADKFIKELASLFQYNDAKNLHKRIQAGIDWFAKDIDEHIMASLQKHKEEMIVKAKTKKYVNELVGVKILFERKKIQLQQTVAIAEALGKSLPMTEVMKRFGEAPVEIIIAEEDKRTRSPKTVKGETNKISLQLFQSGKSIAEIAEARSITAGTVEGHLIQFISTGEIKISQLVSPEKMLAILEVLKANPSMLSTEVRQKLGDQYSYGEIRAVVKYLDTQKK